MTEINGRRGGAEKLQRLTSPRQPSFGTRLKSNVTIKRIDFLQSMQLRLAGTYRMAEVAGSRYPQKIAKVTFGELWSLRLGHVRRRSRSTSPSLKAGASSGLYGHGAPSPVREKTCTFWGLYAIDARHGDATRCDSIRCDALMESCAMTVRGSAWAEVELSDHAEADLIAYAPGAASERSRSQKRDARSRSGRSKGRRPWISGPDTYRGLVLSNFTVRHITSQHGVLQPRCMQILVVFG